MNIFSLSFLPVHLANWTLSCDHATRHGRKIKHGWLRALKLFKGFGFFQDEETRHSLECIQANQIFPRKQLIREDENLQVITGHFDYKISI